MLTYLLQKYKSSYFFFLDQFYASFSRHNIQKLLEKILYKGTTRQRMVYERFMIISLAERKSCIGVK